MIRCLQLAEYGNKVANRWQFHWPLFYIKPIVIETTIANGIHPPVEMYWSLECHSSWGQQASLISELFVFWNADVWYQNHLSMERSKNMKYNVTYDMAKIMCG